MSVGLVKLFYVTHYIDKYKLDITCKPLFDMLELFKVCQRYDFFIRIASHEGDLFDSSISPFFFFYSRWGLWWKFDRVCVDLVWSGLIWYFMTVYSNVKILTSLFYLILVMTAHLTCIMHHSRIFQIVHFWIPESTDLNRWLCLHAEMKAAQFKESHQNMSIMENHALATNLISNQQIRQRS